MMQRRLYEGPVMDGLQRQVTLRDGRGRELCASILVIEPKCLRGGASAAHISELPPVQAGIDARSLLLERCIALARDAGCYKAIIDAPQSSERLLRRCGFKRTSLTMEVSVVSGSPGAGASLPRALACVTAPSVGTKPKYTLRSLCAADCDAYVALLQQLSQAPPMAKAAWDKHLRKLEASGGMLSVFVVSDASRDGQLVACASMLLERAPRGLATPRVGGAAFDARIEDVVVDVSTRGTGLGRTLLHSLLEQAAASGASRARLNCTEANAPFYAKCGFERAANGEACWAAYLRHEE